MRHDTTTPGHTVSRRAVVGSAWAVPAITVAAAAPATAASVLGRPVFNAGTTRAIRMAPQSGWGAVQFRDASVTVLEAPVAAGGLAMTVALSPAASFWVDHVVPGWSGWTKVSGANLATCTNTAAIPLGGTLAISNANPATQNAGGWVPGVYFDCGDGTGTFWLEFRIGTRNTGTYTYDTFGAPSVGPAGRGSLAERRPHAG